MLAANYADLEVLSIAANGKDMSFSSDTGMAECLAGSHEFNGAGGVDSAHSLHDPWLTGRGVSLRPAP